MMCLFQREIMTPTLSSTPGEWIPIFLQPGGRWSVIGFLMTWQEHTLPYWCMHGGVGLCNSLTFSSFMGPSDAWMLSLCNNCTARTRQWWSNALFSLSASITVPMSPQNRGNVLGILVWGFTSISTFLWVWMYTCSKPALFSGLSINIRRHCRQDYTFHKCQLNYVIQSKMTLQQDTKSVTWWVMSGRAELKSRPCFFRIDLWSSQFSNSNFFPH